MLLYNLSASKLEILRKYLEKYIVREFICYLKFFIEAPILFIKKKDSSLRLCVDYCKLNKVIIKNYSSLLLITKSLECLA
jgi:hypothetical protein